MKRTGVAKATVKTFQRSRIKVSTAYLHKRPPGLRQVPNGLGASQLVLSFS